MSNIRMRGAHPESFEIKRLPMGGVGIQWECPKCGTTNWFDHSHDYLKFVMINGGWKTKYLPECDECWLERGESYEHPIEIRAVLTIMVREIDNAD